MTGKQKIQRQITERFLKAIAALPDSERQIALAIGINPQHLSRLKTDTNTYASLYSCHLLCSLYNISPSWLLLNKGKMMM